MAAIANHSMGHMRTEPPCSPNSDVLSKRKKVPPLDLESTKNDFLPDGYIHQNPRPSVLGVPSAMIFRPTKEEFADPYRYIKGIAPVAVKCGIAKIIPPEGWNLGFHLDTEKFRFMTRVQNLSLMDGTSRAFLNYLDQLQRFHNQRGQSLSYIPILDRKPINLLRLKKSVDDLGGYEAVTENKQWAAVGRVIGLGGKTCTSLSHSIKRIFMRWIQPYEEYMARNSVGRKSRKIPRVDQSPEFGVRVDCTGDSSTLDEEFPLDSTDSSGKICQKVEQKKQNATPQSPKSPDVSMIKDRVLKSEESTPGISALEVNREDHQISNDTSARQLDKAGPSEEICEFCGSDANDEKMLLCDGCDRGYHLYCFDPPITEVPSTDWYCPYCLKTTKDSYGFEEKEVRSLYKFQKIANKFKTDYFTEKIGKDLEGPLKVTEDGCEREFWETVQNSYGDLTVEYGADLHSSRHGSGFPTIEKQPYNEYSRCGWNLNVLPLIEGSILNYTKKKGISGIMTPWLYVGMLFSAFCWHAEDQHLYSISYNHWGDTKTWYGIPSESASDMEMVMRKEFPDLFKASPDLLFHLTTLISPKVLMDNGVTCYMADQRPGEFILTFPGAYHCGFSHGFNFTEAVNFALFDWLPHGYKCLDFLSSYKKTPLFPFEEIVFSASEALLSGEVKFDDDDYSHLLNSLTKVCEKELCLRGAIRERNIALEKLTPRSEEDSTYVECSVCSKYCYFSCLLVPKPTDDCEQDKKDDVGSQEEQAFFYYCLDHHDTLTSSSTGQSEDAIFNCYFTDERILSILNGVKDYRKSCSQ